MENIIVTNREIKIWSAVLILSILFGISGFLYGSNKREDYTSLVEEKMKWKEDWRQCTVDRDAYQQNQYSAWRKVKELRDKSVDCEIAEICNKFIEDSYALIDKKKY